MSSFDYNVTGEKRKELVRTISEILGEDPIYQGAPTFAYNIDGYTVSRSGLVTCPNAAAREDIDHLVDALRENGFTPDDVSEETAAARDSTFTVEIPRAGFSEEAYGNLQKIIASKAVLLKKAIGTDSLDIETSADKLIFPWFTLRDLDGETDAYTRLVSALCNMAKTQKRVTARERDSANEKFTMRLFLIRLGFIGDEYKTARKILLRNLTGNGSWKSGHAPERTAHTTADAAPAAEAEVQLIKEVNRKIKNYAARRSGETKVLRCSSGVMREKGLLSRRTAKMILQTLCITAPTAVILGFDLHFSE